MCEAACLHNALLPLCYTTLGSWIILRRKAWGVCHSRSPPPRFIAHQCFKGSEKCVKKKICLTWFQVIFLDMRPYLFMHSTLLKPNIQAKVIAIHCLLHICQGQVCVLKMHSLTHRLLTFYAPIVLCWRRLSQRSVVSSKPPEVFCWQLNS